jgi:hypothetical protein
MSSYKGRGKKEKFSFTFVSEVPKATKARAPRVPKAKVPKVPKVPRVPKAKAPKAPKAPKVPRVPKAKVKAKSKGEAGSNKSTKRVKIVDESEEIDFDTVSTVSTGRSKVPKVAKATKVVRSTSVTIPDSERTDLFGQGHDFGRYHFDQFVDEKRCRPDCAYAKEHLTEMDLEVLCDIRTNDPVDNVPACPSAVSSNVALKKYWITKIGKFEGHPPNMCRCIGCKAKFPPFPNDGRCTTTTCMLNPRWRDYNTRSW